MHDAHDRTVEQLRQFVQSTFGIQFDDSKLDILSDVLQERQEATKSASQRQYLEVLQSSHAEQEFVARRITISETYFFRAPEQFNALMRTVVPNLAENGRRSIRVLSCGCASGEEPYTIAMLATEYANDFPELSFEITGIDLNPAALELAERGLYSPWALRSTSDYYRDKYFKQRGRNFQLKAETRSAVTFRQHNVFQSALSYEFDVIFFRNVLIYFSSETARHAIHNVESMTAENGYLFLGSAETLRGLSESYEILHTEGAFYYRHCNTLARNSVRHAKPQGHPPLRAEEPTAPEVDNGWFEDIHRSSNRIQQLVGQWNQNEARTVNTQATVVASPATASRKAKIEDPEELTLGVISELARGNTAEAEQTCSRLIEVSNMDASAHYLMALCREQRGDLYGAIEQDEIAAYLDPTFSMPQLHKGMLSCRTGNVESGRRSLEKSLELLRTEDSARILLLGGGFHRQSLIHACKRELARCKGART